MGLKNKEKLFCQFYYQTRSAKEAALHAGFLLQPELAANRLLQRREVLNEIERLQQEQPDLKNEVEAGYRRAAFSSVTDAVKLLFMGDQPDFGEVEKMDLFQVSEMKYQKDKGMEIRFFDRLRALEKLEELSRAKDENGSSAFYRALEEGAKRISEKGDE